MRDRSWMLRRVIWLASTACTPSPASAAGRSPSSSQDGPAKRPSGQVRVRANRSPRPVDEAAKPTSAISGPSGSSSSTPADLHSSSENRSQAPTDSAGSILFTTTSKERATPSGRKIAAQRSQGRRTSDRGSGSAPSEETHWPTPSASGADRGGSIAHMDGRRSNLIDTAQLAAPWATPQAFDAVNQNTPDQWWARQLRNVNMSAASSPTGLSIQAQLAGWPTTTTQDGSSSGAMGYSTESGRHSGVTLTDAARLSGWATPVSTEIGNTLENYQAMKANMKSGPRTAITHPSLQAQLVIPGPISSGSHVEMGSCDPPRGSGQLNSRFSGWIMGYPPDWGDFAPKTARKATTSTRSPRAKKAA